VRKGWGRRGGSVGSKGGCRGGRKGGSILIEKSPPTNFKRENPAGIRKRRKEKKRK